MIGCPKGKTEKKSGKGPGIKDNLNGKAWNRLQLLIQKDGDLETGNKMEFYLQVKNL